MLKVIFMGTPDFARKSLECIYNKGYNIVSVVTNPDKPKGRGMKNQISEVKEFAIEKNIKVIQPEKIRENKEFAQEIKRLNPDVICVVAYGKILPKEILEIPRYGCINVHGSLLPKYRGSAPIQWAILNGDKTTGVTTMYMDEGMDTGDIILSEEITISEDETTGTLWEKLSNLGGEILVKTLDKIEKGVAPRKKQGENYSMAPMLNKEMSQINWEQNASKINNLIRGLNPIMGAYTMLNNKKLKIWKARIIDLNGFINDKEEFKEYKEKIENLEPGTIIYIDKKIGVYIKTGDDVLLLEEVQAENARKMSIQDFLRGNKIEVGTIL